MMACSSLWHGLTTIIDRAARLKILYHHRIASKDGQYIHLSAIVRELTKLGHDVILCGPNIAEAGQMGGGKVWVDWLKRTIPQAIYELIAVGVKLVVASDECA